MTLNVFKKLFVTNFRRAILISIVVGSILVLINHGDHITEEPVCDNFFAKCAMCFAVPFMVSIISAMLAGRERARADEDRFTP